MHDGKVVHVARCVSKGLTSTIVSSPALEAIDSTTHQRQDRTVARPTVWCRAGTGTGCRHTALQDLGARPWREVM